MRKLLVLPLVAVAAFMGQLSAEDLKIGFVNFKLCLEKSKKGMQENQAFTALKNQMQETLEATDKELADLAGKLENQDYLDSLSPTAEEELKKRFQHLSQEFSRYQAQYYQLLNQANYKMFQSLHEQVAVASNHIREKQSLSLVLNEDSVFAFAPALDITTAVIGEMDRLYDLENAEIAQLSKTSGQTRR